MAVKASAQITLTYIIDVKAYYRYYLLQSSTASTPSKPTTYPPTSWDDTEPTYTEGSTNSLYFVDCTVFNDDTFVYSEVSLSSAYESAKLAYNKAVNAQTTADSANDKIDNLEIGGVNLFSGYGEEEIQLPDYREVGSFKQFVGNLIFDPAETVGETYTISFWAKSPNGTTPLSIYNSNGQPRYFRISLNEVTSALGTEWEYFYVTMTNTDRGEDYDDDTNICNRIEFYAADQLGVLVKKIQVEKGNRPTDWERCQVDIDEDIRDVQTAVESVDAKLTIADETITALAEQIANLVTDGNGASLMTQTSDGGWTFNMGNFDGRLNTTSDELAALLENVTSMDALIEAIKSTLDDHGATLEYVNITTLDGQPCIELGEGDSDFKLRITNTSIQFIEGSDIPAWITNQALHIKKAVIEEEQQIGGFAWVVRSNGNMGLMWKGVES